MRKDLLFGIVATGLVVAAAFGGCGERENVKKVDLSKKKEEPREVATEPEGAIRIAVGAMISPHKTLTYYQTLLDYISQKLGQPVVLVQRRTYEEVNDLLKTENVECAFICSGPYIQVHQDFGVELLVVPVVDGHPRYFSYIIVHKDSQIRKFKELKGKSFAFTGPLSLTGARFPTCLLAEKGFTPQQYFSKVLFAHTHDNSIKVVAEKLVDGGAVDSLIWDYFQATDPEFTAKTKIILKSPAFGIPPVVVPAELDPELKEKLRTIFLQLHEDERSKKILGELRIDKFIIAEDAMYDSIRHMEAEAKSSLGAGAE